MFQSGEERNVVKIFSILVLQHTRYYLLNHLTFFLSLHNTKVQNLLFPYQITQIFYLIRTEKKASTTFLFPLVIRLSDDGMQIRHGFFLCFIFFFRLELFFFTSHLFRSSIYFLLRSNVLYPVVIIALHLHLMDF
uniref:Uncharacterized protein n=1 Tax=Cacopsylla melanoneura TaxID=428564 RepID=A0A8D9B2M3_9HEMI